MSNAKASMGTALSRAGYTIAELTKIGSPKLQLNSEETTSLQSPDGYKEFIGTLLEAGEVPIEGNFIAGDTNGQIGLVTDMNAKTLQAFVITYPDGTTFTFNALVSSFELGEADVKGILSFKASLKISGKPALGISASTGCSNVVITTATIYPAFAIGVFDYVATSTGSSITVTPTAAAGVITVNGNVVNTGVPSSAIALGAANSVTIITVVVTETGKAPKTYTFRVTKTA